MVFLIIVSYDQETVLQKQIQQAHDKYFSLTYRIQCVGDAKEKEQVPYYRHRVKMTTGHRNYLS